MDPVTTRPADYTQFIKAVTRSGRPAHLPNYEHIASIEFIAEWTGQPISRMPVHSRERWAGYVGFWRSMGFDVVPMEIPLRCPLPETENIRRGAASEERAVIHNREEFDRYPWPDESAAIDFAPFAVADRAPFRQGILGPGHRELADGLHADRELPDRA